MPRNEFWYIYFSIIFLFFIFQMDKNYYLQVLLEESEYLVKGMNIKEYFDRDIELIAFL